MAASLPTTPDADPDSDAEPDKASDAADPANKVKDYVAVGIAVIALIAFLIAAYALWIDADTAKDTQWARQTYVFAGIEAIAFTAIGWMFGEKVHRAQAATADKATKDAAKAKTDAAKAKSQAQSLKAVVVAHAAGGGPVAQGAGGAGPAGTPSLDVLADQARGIVPD